MSNSPSSPEIEHGGDLVARVLKQHGVNYLFSLCGGHISPILLGCDSLNIQVIDVRDEKNAAFAADAISRLTGTPGVVAVTAGPGVTNTMTALKNAQLAESPLVVLGGATATMLEGRGALQDIDQLGLVKSATKLHMSVRNVRDIIPSLEKAFHEARSDVPGPVFVELPVDILYPEEVVKDWYAKKSNKKQSLLGRIVNWYTNRHVNNLFKGDYEKRQVQIIPPSYPEPSENQIESILESLSMSTKPVMVLSSQAVTLVDKVKKLQEIVETLGIPVFLSGMARGLLGKDHSLHIRHKRSKALREADVIILVGVPLDFRLDYGRILNRNGTVISINRSKDTLNMNRIFRGVDVKIHAEPYTTLTKVADQYAVNTENWQDWHQVLLDRQKERDTQIAEISEMKTEYVNPVDLLFSIDDIMDEDSVIVADGGDFVATMSYIVQPRGPLRWLDPGPFGTLGVGAGFVLGSALTYETSLAWLFYGDGAAGFSINEFDTFVRHDIPVIAIVGNDASWQQIAREQVEMFDSSLGTELAYTSYEKVAEGYGAVGILIESPDQVVPKLNEAKKLAKSGRAVLVNVKIGTTDFRKGSISM